MSDESPASLRSPDPRRTSPQALPFAAPETSPSAPFVDADPDPGSPFAFSPDSFGSASAAAGSPTTGLFGRLGRDTGALPRQGTAASDSESQTCPSTAAPHAAMQASSRSDFCSGSTSGHQHRMSNSTEPHRASTVAAARPPADGAVPDLERKPVSFRLQMPLAPTTTNTGATSGSPQRSSMSPMRFGSFRMGPRRGSYDDFGGGVASPVGAVSVFSSVLHSRRGSDETDAMSPFAGRSVTSPRMVAKLAKAPTASALAPPRPMGMRRPDSCVDLSAAGVAPGAPQGARPTDGLLDDADIHINV